MICHRIGTALWMVLWLVATELSASNESQFAAPRTAVTPNSIGIECDLEGDANHNAQARLAYRESGASSWNEALALLRVDYQGWYAGAKADRHYNMLAGSVMFLKPQTTYELRLVLDDPDGGHVEQTLEVTTRRRPERPAGGRIWHVRPSGRRGRGTEDAPFGNVEEAQKVAEPGDIILLRAGNYGRIRCHKSGAPGRHLVFLAEDEGEVNVAYFEVAASHVWIEGMYVSGQSRIGLQAMGQSTDVVIHRNLFVGFPFSIMLGSSSADWQISDNLLLAGNPSKVGGVGIDLGKSSGHVVSHNRIARSADGIAYPKSNCDIFGNDLLDLREHGFKGDYAYANNRFWGNRLTNVGGEAVTMQPMFCGPWYFVRNQVCHARRLFKFRVQDRFVWVHNTVLGPSPLGDHWHYFLTAYSRNNLFIATGAGESDAGFWVGQDCRPASYCLPNNYRPTWATDIDHDGFDWGTHATPFVWDNGQARFASLEQFSAAVGIEQHGRRLDKEQLFAHTDWSVRDAGYEPTVLTLREAGPAIDAGVPVPNLAGPFQGRAPDLGAHEFGAEPLVYGPLDPNRAYDSVVSSQP